MLLVDAMNVIGSRPTGWWRDRPGAIRRLVARLDRYAGHTGTAVTVVVDGRPLPDLPEGLHGHVEVVYARRSGPDAADDRIVELLDERGESVDGRGPPVEERGAAVEVVTSDRELRRRVTARGAGVTAPRSLLAALDRLDAQH